MTWQPRILEGGATPSAEPPLVWEHVDGETISATWLEAPGRWYTAILRISDAGPVFVRGHRPDETTLRELSEDIERWHAAQADDGGHLESARWGARYHA